jgi:hypothetical protein
MSVRVSADLRERLQREAARMGEPPASLAERYIEEGLRQHSHPLIRFVDGPTGRRARLIPGPDVWEIVAFIRRSTAAGEKKVGHAADWFDISSAQVEAALAYYGAFPSEIDDRIRLNEHAQVEADRVAHGRSRLLA